MAEADRMLVRSADSAAMLRYWEQSDTLVDGIEAMRRAGTRYLPQFPDELADDYKFRLNETTVMTNIFADIVESLSSKPFEKETEFAGDDVPQELLDFEENVDGSGNNLSVFAASAFYNGVKSALHWIMIDYPVRDPSIVSLADAKAAGLRPFWTHILAINVLEVRSRFINSREFLTYVRILEPGKPDHIRVMTLDGGIVSYEVFEKTQTWDEERKTFFKVIESGTLDIDEIPLVPFFTGRRNGKTFKFDPPLRAASDLQVHLYQQESGLNYVTTLTAYPMLSGNGVKPQMDAAGNVKKLPTGPNRVLYAPPNADGTVGSWRYVEPNSNSLTFLSQYIEKIIGNLRELGRQPLTASSSNLTTVTTAFAAGKSKSAVKAWAVMLSDALENAARITAKWMDLPYEAEVSVYTEFDDFVDGKDYEALQEARKNRDISRKTYLTEMKRRGLLSSEFDAAADAEELLKELPGDGPDNNPADSLDGLPV